MRKLRKLWLTSDGLQCAANGVLSYQFDKGVQGGTSLTAQAQIPDQRVREGERWLVQYVTWDSSPSFLTTPIGRLYIVDDQTVRVVNSFRGNRGQAGPFTLEAGETIRLYFAGMRLTDTTVINVRGYIMSTEDDDDFFTQGMVLQALAALAQPATPPGDSLPFGFASLFRAAGFPVPNGGFGTKVTGMTGGEQVPGGGTFLGTPDQLTVPAEYSGRSFEMVIRGGFNANPNGSRVFGVSINGGAIAYPWQIGANPDPGSVTQSVNVAGGQVLNAGDTLELYAYQNSGVNPLNALSCALEIHTIDW